MKQITIKDIEKFINDETFNSDYYYWDKSDCSLVGLIIVLLKQEIRNARKDPYEYRWEELLKFLEENKELN